MSRFKELKMPTLDNIFSCISPDAHPWPAYIVLDLDSGGLDADYTTATNSVPADVYHNRKIRFEIECTIHVDDLKFFCEDHAESFQAILDDSEIVWNDSNHVGKLGVEANKHVDLITKALEELRREEGGIISDLSSFVESDIDWDNPAIKVAKDIFSYDGTDDFYFSDQLNSVYLILSAVLDMWAEKLYAGDDLTITQLEELIGYGACEGSEWQQVLLDRAGETDEGDLEYFKAFDLPLLAGTPEWEMYGDCEVVWFGETDFTRCEWKRLERGELLNEAGNENINKFAR
jgi:hypothetical protein